MIFADKCLNNSFKLNSESTSDDDDDYMFVLLSIDIGKRDSFISPFNFLGSLVAMECR